MEQTKPKSRSLGLWATGLTALVAGSSALYTIATGESVDAETQQTIVSWGQRVILAIDELAMAGLALAGFYGRLRATARLR